MPCDSSLTPPASALQIRDENEDARSSVDCPQDDPLPGAAASDQRPSFAHEYCTNLSAEEAPRLPSNSLELGKGIDLAEAEPVDLEVGQGSREHDEEGKCRVCHVVFEGASGTTEAMQLGCNCKNDLSIAHRECAETWFKIRGNRICEICGATAQNIVGIEDTGFMEQWNDRSAGTLAEPQARCWQSLSLCNFFLGCMVVTFILLWLFRVTFS